MFTIFLFSPEDRALLTRLLDYLDGQQQAKIDAMAAQVRDVTERLHNSQENLQSAEDSTK